MTLFARRTLQRALDENARFLTSGQLSVACNLLNTPHDNYLGTEWEQVILNAASRCGHVEHESKLGASKPDLLFKSQDGQLEFVADITTASDDGFHKLNPVDAFDEEFRRRVYKSGWFAGGFYVEIDAHTNRLYRGLNDRVRLKLPKREEWTKEIFNSEFNTFLRRIRQKPEQKQRFDVITPKLGVHITYDPAKRGTSGGRHLAYTIATAIDRNPVYNALKAKGDQLKKTQYQGMTGIFLCDGGCQMLTARPTWSSFSTDEVIRSFFRQFDSVWFVVVFAVRESDSQRSIQAKLFLNPKRKAPEFLRLKEVVDSILKSLPEPQFSAHNARLRLKSRDLTGRYFGRLTVGGSVEMSAREMLEMLAGAETPEQFEQRYRLEPSSNPFKRALREGRLISKVTIEHIPEKDDDKVTIEFGPRDAAIAALRAP